MWAMLGRRRRLRRSLKIAGRRRCRRL